ncbi:MAG: hypothetical protein QNJ72_27670 [Pleurocapsa sp. MO_226.B13]|nr:hypothetical protein [Pleurocapsa sp. MO_226.B13]
MSVVSSGLSVVLLTTNALGATYPTIPIAIGGEPRRLCEKSEGYKKVSQSWSALFKWISFSQRLLPADRPNCEG